MLIGIIGKPSAGKSTFLNAACLTNAKTANYPFTTIEPNLGTSYVRVNCVCRELNVKDDPKNSLCINGIRYIPIKLLDVAGIVPGAHEGKGMGFQFLSDLARANALIHVVDFSGSLDEEGQDVEEGSYDPLNDIEFLEREINFWFKNLIIKQDWQKFSRKIQQEKLSLIDSLYERLSGISVKKKHIIQAINETKLEPKKITDWTDKDILYFASVLRKISKPIIIAANKIDKKKAEKNFNRIKEMYPDTIFPTSALAEFFLRTYEKKGIIDYNPGDKSFKIVKPELLKEKELKVFNDMKDKIFKVFNGTGIQQVLNKVVFDILNQIVVYPVADANSFSDHDGRILPDAYLVENQINIKDFVNQKIHSDLAKNFIYAIDARTKLRLGENYLLKNNDIIKIVSAARSK